MKPRIYVDTSVIGGCEDPQWREDSRRLMERFGRGELVLVVSDITLAELADAPANVRGHLSKVATAHIETVQLTAESQELGDAYIAEGVIATKLRADAQHIGIATVARVDVLVSWNFKHIVNLRRIHGFNSVNLRRGYPLLEIRSPREVLQDE